MKSQFAASLKALVPVIGEICTKTGAPSVAVGVSLGGETIFESNFGSRDVERPGLRPDSDTIYAIGSITKVFTASALGILVDEQKLDWSTPVREILPQLNSTSAFVTSDLTVVDLLSHRTALAVSTDWWTGSDGELLLDKAQTLPYFNALKPVGSLRSRYDYNNWNFALLGEIIETLSGKSYGTFLKERIFDPLQMERSSASHVFNDDVNFAFAHAVLEKGQAVRVPQPSSEDGKIMASAQGVQSTVNDLLRYGNSLLNGYAHELGDRSTAYTGPLKNLGAQFKARTPRGPLTMLDASYCLGVHRHILPNTFSGLGCNGMFVSQMPTIVPGNDVRLVLQHGGSLAGYTTFFSILPEQNTTVAILVNSIGLGDPASWIHHLVLETLVESKQPNDYVSLAEEAARNHAGSISQIKHELAEARQDVPLSRPLDDFVGCYRDLNQDFKVVIRKKVCGDDQSKDPSGHQEQQSGLELLFQGRETQKWDLEHYQDDTFILQADFDDLARRAVFTFVDDAYFTFRFEAVESSVKSNQSVSRLYWAHDPVVPAEEQFFVKMTDKTPERAEESAQPAQPFGNQHEIQRPVTKNTYRS